MPTESSGHILVVDDDAAIRSVLRALLEREGYIVSEARNRAELLSACAANAIDLITLDLNLDGDDGLGIVRMLKQCEDVPIIMVTAKCDAVDRVVGLELGADDYIVKPFNLREVLARVRAVLRRCERQTMVASRNATLMFFGDFGFDGDARELRRSNGELVPLTTNEFNLLEILVKRPRRVLTRETLLDLLNGDAATSFDRSIDTMIGRLRRKIEDDTEMPGFIKTVRGVGYVFTPTSRAGL